MNSILRVSLLTVFFLPALCQAQEPTYLLSGTASPGSQQRGMGVTFSFSASKDGAGYAASINCDVSGAASFSASTSSSGVGSTSLSGMTTGGMAVGSYTAECSYPNPNYLTDTADAPYITTDITFMLIDTCTAWDASYEDVDDTPYSITWDLTVNVTGGNMPPLSGDVEATGIGFDDNFGTSSGAEITDCSGTTYWSTATGADYPPTYAPQYSSVSGDSPLSFWWTVTSWSRDVPGGCSGDSCSQYTSNTIPVPVPNTDVDVLTPIYCSDPS